MTEPALMNPDGTCARCGHMATEHAHGCSQCSCELVAEAAKEPDETEGIGKTIDSDFGLTLRLP
jgi:hypothetical protein